jgi:nitrite reductase/ring-hydroxylating ferredoxin subunit/DMSO/TMAO reductase YedYZ heme-binding membrane subunit
MLTIILMIGPLARINERFVPLLYNRRHFGVMTFVVGLLHVAVVLGWYHAGGEINPLVSVFISNARYDTTAGIPFEVFGVAAFVILFLMAATSHDFWLNTLSPAAWKTLHMLVYVAYGALVLHIALGVLQDELNLVYAVMLGASVALVGGLHLVAGFAEWGRDRGAVGADGWLDVGPWAEIPDDRARIVSAGEERIAVFRYDGKVSAVSNLCAHQNGPLGEGAVKDGCITCPWHGYQYDPANGRSPPPFTEKIATFRTRIRDGRVEVDPTPLPPGTPVDPTPLGAA